MAKSMRSKSKRRFRAIKRVEVFAPVEEERLQQQAKEQAEAALVESLHMQTEKTSENDQTIVDDDEEQRGRKGAPLAAPKMEIDGFEPTPKQLKRQKMQLYLSGNQFRKKKRIAKLKATGRKAPKIARKGRKI
ncbi:hypothetical protein SmJEL517_g05075 [Synchytrium microbalum]|uniref:DUF2423 domain-containing protein n=1 Tax=Synchytrium microbalum TaxID=1806994 RepID=A0A507BNH8_9FUNG|nr:uncharacterized protein SmJEL517_g05075 [Synchytrium microbalum]TPX31650.1 hypothetical protein SmJEL517_g05075 [Synchytrium microbalum]